MPRTMLADCAQLYPLPLAVWCTKNTPTGPVYSGAPRTIDSSAPHPARVTIRGTGRAGSATEARAAVEARRPTGAGTEGAGRGAGALRNAGVVVAVASGLIRSSRSPAASGSRAPRIRARTASDGPTQSG